MDQQISEQKILARLINEKVLIGNLTALKIKLCPSSLFSNDHERSITPILAANNIGSDEQYTISIISFIEITHAFIKSEHLKGSSLKQESIRFLSNKNNNSNSKSWFTLFTAKENKKSNYDMSSYKDLVELASALDMGGSDDTLQKIADN